MSTKDGSILYLDGVTVSFDGFRALNSLSLILDRGEMRAIIGPNGAGKTTMMDVVTGKTKADSGEVYFNGTVDLRRLDEAAIAQLGIGRKFQKPTVFRARPSGTTSSWRLPAGAACSRRCSIAAPRRKASGSTRSSRPSG